MRKKKGKSLKVLAAILFLLAGFAMLSYKPSTKAIETAQPSYFVDLRGYERVYPQATVLPNIGIITLTNKCYKLIARTEVTQAMSIEKGLQHKIDFRPTTHDIIAEIFDQYGVRLLAVKIDGIINNTFTSKLVIKSGNKIIKLDARPSDGIAIAVRTSSPIYIKKELLEKYGTNLC